MSNSNGSNQSSVNTNSNNSNQSRTITSGGNTPRVNSHTPVSGGVVGDNNNEPVTPPVSILSRMSINECKSIWDVMEVTETFNRPNSPCGKLKKEVPDGDYVKLLKERSKHPHYCSCILLKEDGKKDVMIYKGKIVNPVQKIDCKKTMVITVHEI